MSITSETNASRVMRELYSPELQAELINAPVNKYGGDYMSFGDKKKSSLTFENIAEIQTLRVGDFFRGLRSSIGAGTWATPNDIQHIPRDGWGEIANSIGHYLGFKADFAALDFAGKGIAKMFGGVKRLPSWEKSVSDYWNRYPERRENMVRTGIVRPWRFKQVQKRVRDPELNPNFIKADDSLFKVLMKTDAKNGVIKLPDALDKEPVKLIGGDILGALNFGIKMGTRGSIQEAMMARKIGVYDNKGVLRVRPDDLDTGDLFKVGLFGSQAFTPTEDFKFWNMPMLKGFGEGFGIHMASLVAREFVRPLFKGPDAELAREMFSESVLFGAIDALPYWGEENFGRKYAIGALVGGLFGGGFEYMGRGIRRGWKVAKGEDIGGKDPIEKGFQDLQDPFVRDAFKRDLEEQDIDLVRSFIKGDIDKDRERMPEGDILTKISDFVLAGKIPSHELKNSGLMKEVLTKIESKIGARGATEYSSDLVNLLTDLRTHLNTTIKDSNSDVRFDSFKFEEGKAPEINLVHYGPDSKLKSWASDGGRVSGPEGREYFQKEFEMKVGRKYSASEQGWTQAKGIPVNINILKGDNFNINNKSKFSQTYLNLKEIENLFKLRNRIYDLPDMPQDIDLSRDPESNRQLMEAAEKERAREAVEILNSMDVKKILEEVVGINYEFGHSPDEPGVDFRKTLEHINLWTRAQRVLKDIAIEKATRFYGPEQARELRNDLKAAKSKQRRFQLAIGAMFKADKLFGNNKNPGTKAMVVKALSDHSKALKGANPKEFVDYWTKSKSHEKIDLDLSETPGRLFEMLTEHWKSRFARGLDTDVAPDVIQNGRRMMEVIKDMGGVDWLDASQKYEGDTVWAAALKQAYKESVEEIAMYEPGSVFGKRAPAAAGFGLLTKSKALGLEIDTDFWEIGPDGVKEVSDMGERVFVNGRMMSMEEAQQYVYDNIEFKTYMSLKDLEDVDLSNRAFDALKANDSFNFAMEMNEMLSRGIGKKLLTENRIAKQLFKKGNKDLLEESFKDTAGLSSAALDKIVNLIKKQPLIELDTGKIVRSQAWRKPIAWQIGDKKYLAHKTIPDAFIVTDPGKSEISWKIGDDLSEETFNRLPGTWQKVPPNAFPIFKSGGNPNKYRRRKQTGDLPFFTERLSTNKIVNSKQQLNFGEIQEFLRYVNDNVSKKELELPTDWSRDKQNIWKLGTGEEVSDDTGFDNHDFNLTIDLYKRLLDKSIDKFLESDNMETPRFKDFVKFQHEHLTTLQEIISPRARHTKGYSFNGFASRHLKGLMKDLSGKMTEKELYSYFLRMSSKWSGEEPIYAAEMIRKIKGKRWWDAVDSGVRNLMGSIMTETTQKDYAADSDTGTLGLMLAKAYGKKKIIKNKVHYELDDVAHERAVRQLKQYILFKMSGKKEDAKHFARKQSPEFKKLAEEMGTKYLDYATGIVRKLLNTLPDSHMDIASKTDETLRSDLKEFFGEFQTSTDNMFVLDNLWTLWQNNNWDKQRTIDNTHKIHKQADNFIIKGEQMYGRFLRDIANTIANTTDWTSGQHFTVDDLNLLRDSSWKREGFNKMRKTNNRIKEMIAEETKRDLSRELWQSHHTDWLSSPFQKGMSDETLGIINTMRDLENAEIGNMIALDVEKTEKWYGSENGMKVNFTPETTKEGVIPKVGDTVEIMSIQRGERDKRTDKKTYEYDGPDDPRFQREVDKWLDREVRAAQKFGERVDEDTISSSVERDNLLERLNAYTDIWNQGFMNDRMGASALIRRKKLDAKGEPSGIDKPAVGELKSHFNIGRLHKGFYYIEDDMGRELFALPQYSFPKQLLPRRFPTIGGKKKTKEQQKINNTRLKAIEKGKNKGIVSSRGKAGYNKLGEVGDIIRTKQGDFRITEKIPLDRIRTHSKKNLEYIKNRKAFFVKKFLSWKGSKTFKKGQKKPYYIEDKMMPGGIRVIGAGREKGQYGMSMFQFLAMIKQSLPKKLQKIEQVWDKDLLAKVSKAENIKEDKLKEYFGDYKNKNWQKNMDLILFEPISKDRIESIFPGGKPTREIEMIPSVYTAMKKYAVAASIPETQAAAAFGANINTPIDVTRFAGTTGDYFRHLDNAAPRPFTYKGMDFKSVEHAYQTLKTGRFNDEIYKKDWSDFQRHVNPGKFGSEIPDIDASQRREYTNTLMMDLVKESFKQDKLAQEYLRHTGDRELRHPVKKAGKGSYWQYRMPVIWHQIRKDMFGGSDGMNTITPHYEYGLKFTRGKPQVIELTRPRETKDLQVSGLEWEDVRSTVRSENQIYRELVEKEYDKAFEILKKRHWRKALDTSGLEQLRKASRKPLTEIKQQQLRNLAKARADMEAKRPITLSVQYDRPFTLEKLDDVMMYNSSQKFSRAMVKANPDHLFVYETNVEDAKNPKKKGLGNARIKGLTNTIGIRSRPKPGKEDYWVEQTAEEKKKVQKIIEEDLKKLKEKMKDKKVVFLNSGYWNGSPPGDLKGVTPYKELFSEMISEVVPGYENIKHQRGQSDWEDYNAARNYDNSFLKGTNEIPDNVMRELVAERMEKNKELSAEQARDEIIRDGAASEYYKGIVDIRKEQETIRELVERTTGYEEYIQHKDIEGSDYQQRSDTPVYHAKVTDVTKTTKTEKRINKKGQTEEYSYSSYEARLIPKYRMKRNVQAYGGKTYTTVERHRNYNENVHFDPSTTEITGLKKEDARAYTRPLTFTKKLIDIADINKDLSFAEILPYMFQAGYSIKVNEKPMSKALRASLLDNAADWETIYSRHRRGEIKKEDAASLMANTFGNVLRHTQYYLPGINKPISSVYNQDGGTTVESFDLAMSLDPKGNVTKGETKKSMERLARRNLIELTSRLPDMTRYPEIKDSKLMAKVSAENPNLGVEDLIRMLPGIWKPINIDVAKDVEKSFAVKDRDAAIKRYFDKLYKINKEFFVDNTSSEDYKSFRELEALREVASSKATKTDLMFYLGLKHSSHHLPVQVFNKFNIYEKPLDEVYLDALPSAIEYLKSFRDAAQKENIDIPGYFDGLDFNRAKFNPELDFSNLKTGKGRGNFTVNVYPNMLTSDTKSTGPHFTITLNPKEGRQGMGYHLKKVVPIDNLIKFHDEIYTDKLGRKEGSYDALKTYASEYLKHIEKGKKGDKPLMFTKKWKDKKDELYINIFNKVMESMGPVSDLVTLEVQGNPDNPKFVLETKIGMTCGTCDFPNMVKRLWGNIKEWINKDGANKPLENLSKSSDVFLNSQAKELRMRVEAQRTATSILDNLPDQWQRDLVLPLSNIVPGMKKAGQSDSEFFNQRVEDLYKEWFQTEGGKYYAEKDKFDPGLQAFKEKAQQAQKLGFQLQEMMDDIREKSKNHIKANTSYSQEEVDKADVGSQAFYWSNLLIPKEKGMDRAEFTDKRRRFYNFLLPKFRGIKLDALISQIEDIKKTGKIPKEMEKSDIPNKGDVPTAWKAMLSLPELNLKHGFKKGKRKQKQNELGQWVTYFEGGKEGSSFRDIVTKKDRKRNKEWTAELNAVIKKLKEVRKEVTKFEKESTDAIKKGMDTKEFEKKLKESYTGGRLLGREVTPFMEYSRIIDYGFGVEGLQKELQALQKKYPKQFEGISFQTDPITQIGTWMLSRGKWWDNTLTYHRLEQNIIKLVDGLGYTQISRDYLVNAMGRGGYEKLNNLLDYLEKRGDDYAKTIRPVLDKLENESVEFRKEIANTLIEKLQKTPDYVKLDTSTLSIYNKFNDNSVLVYKPSKEHYDRMYKVLDIEKHEGYKKFVEGSHWVKKLIMYNPMFHGWNLAINAAATKGLKGIPKDDAELKPIKDVMLRQAEKEAWSEQAKKDIDLVSYKDFQMFNEMVHGFGVASHQANTPWKGLFPSRKEKGAWAGDIDMSNPLKMPIDLTHPMYQVMIDYGFPLGTTRDAMGRMPLDSLDKETGQTWKEKINRAVGYKLFGDRIKNFSNDWLFQVISPAYEAQMFWRTFHTARKQLEKKHPEWKAKELDESAGRVAERIATTMSGKLHKMDLSKNLETIGRAALFANHWTMSNARTLFGMFGYGNNLVRHESVGPVLQSQFVGGVVRWILYKWILSQLMNTAVTGKPTWENEPARRDKVAIPSSVEEGHLFIDLNRFINDLWNLARPSMLSGAVTGAVLSRGLAPAGLGALGIAVGATVGGAVGASINRPVSEFANKWIGLPGEEDAIAPQANLLWRKLNPAVTYALSFASNADSWNREQIRRGDHHWTKQAVNSFAHIFTSLTPINNNQLVTDTTTFDALFTRLSGPKWAGLAAGFWVSESRKLGGYITRQKILEDEYRKGVHKIMADNATSPEFKKKRRKELAKEYIVNRQRLKKELKEFLDAYEEENLDE